MSGIIIPDISIRVSNTVGNIGSILAFRNKYNNNIKKILDCAKCGLYHECNKRTRN